MERIDQFIDRKKQTEPNPFLSTRIMEAIRQLKEGRRERRFCNAVITTSIAFAILIAIGMSSLGGSNNTDTVSVNDAYIENLDYFTMDK